jgi:hypothetical protein
MAAEQKDTQDWAVVISGVNKYVGNITHEEGVAANQWVVLNPCYEYMSDLQIAQGPQGQIALAGRTKILVPFDHTLIPFPVTCHVTCITRIRDMAPEDAKGYMETIESAKEMAEKMRRKRDTSLLIVPANALPKGEPPRAS